MALTKKDRIAFVKAGLEGYARLNDASKKRTSKADWIALKLGCTVPKARAYVLEAEAETAAEKPAEIKPVVTSRNEYSVYFERTVTMTYSTEVRARDEAEAIELAKKEADNSLWVEGDIFEEKKPIIRSVRGGA